MSRGRRGVHTGLLVAKLEGKRPLQRSRHRCTLKKLNGMA